MSYRKPKLLANVIIGVLAVVVIAFAVSFGWLIFNAFSLADTTIGLNMSFTGYAYISIEATFVALMLYAGYYVFRNAQRRPTIEVEVLEE
jgi:TRAP-type C4-dicarboxylate transport system permease small subunit